MRIHFESTVLPKKAAKRIAQAFNNPYFPEGRVSMSRALDVVSCALGYASWHELNTLVSKGEFEPSPLDEDCSPEIQKQRLEYQTGKFQQEFSCYHLDAMEMATKFRVSSRNPRSPGLFNQRYSNNLIAVDKFGEWRFHPSFRSQENAEEVDTILDLYDTNKLTHENFVQRILVEHQKRPECLYVAEVILYNYESICVIYNFAPFLKSPKKLISDIEEVMLLSLPPGFSWENPMDLNWGVVSNRPFIRTAYHLANAFMAEGDLEKYTRWSRLYRDLTPIQESQTDPDL